MLTSVQLRFTNQTQPETSVRWKKRQSCREIRKIRPLLS